jgi:hypothetical protein
MKNLEYKRVIPRDLFNEAKLLKCLGQLSLLIHDGKCPKSLQLQHNNPEQGFLIGIDESDGGVYCHNLKLFLGEIEIYLVSVLNSKDNYPLLYRDDNEEGEVFTKQGELSQEFLEMISKL